MPITPSASTCLLMPPGVMHIFGRQSNDTRKCECLMDQGNADYGCVGGEALIIFDKVFVP